MKLLEGLSETLRFSIFSSLFLLSFYFLSYNFLYHKNYSLFLSLHPKNKTLAHLPLSVDNHPRVVLHHHVFEFLILEILDEFWVLTASCLRAYSATISYPFFTILNISKKVAFKKAPHGHHAKISILAHLLFVEYMLRDHFPLS